MCPFIASERYNVCHHTVEINTGKKAPFCLLGDLCEEVGYAHKVFRPMPGKCPRCLDAEAAATNKASETKASKRRGLLDGPWPAPHTPHYRGDKERCVTISQQELKKALENDKLTDRNCRDLLYYILGLPPWLSKGRLVAEFGYGVYGYYGAAWEQDMVGIAQRKRFDNALVAGMKKKKEEVAGMKKQGEAASEK